MNYSPVCSDIYLSFQGEKVDVWMSSKYSRPLQVERMTLIYHLPNAAPRAKTTHQPPVKIKTSRPAPPPSSTDHAIQRKASRTALAITKTRDNSTQTKTPLNQNLEVASALQIPDVVATDEPTPGELAFLTEMAHQRERSRKCSETISKFFARTFMVLVVAANL